MNYGLFNGTAGSTVGGFGPSAFYPPKYSWTAGLAVSPRGLGAILVMPLAAILSGRIDHRWLIVSGFGLFAFSSMWMGQLTTDISQWSLILPIVFSGAAAGMVFVPLSTTTVGTLRNEQIGNASGLYNLPRNVGGGIGISVVNTLVARHQQIHRAELSRYISGRLLVSRSLSAVQALTSARSGPALAAPASIRPRKSGPLPPPSTRVFTGDVKTCTHSGKYMSGTNREPMKLPSGESVRRSSQWHDECLPQGVAALRGIGGPLGQREELCATTR